MNTWHTAIVLTGLLVVGLARQLFLLRKKQGQIYLAKQFLKILTLWYNGNGEDHDAYNVLLSQLDSMQRMMHNVDSGYAHSLAGITGMRREFADRWCDRQSITNRFLTAEASIRRFIGSSETYLCEQRRRLCNPILLLISGIRATLETPLMILSETNVISGNSRNSIINSKPFSFLHSVTVLVTLLQAIRSVVNEWGWFRYFFGF